MYYLLEKLSVLYFSFVLNKEPAVKKTPKSLPVSGQQVHSRLYSSKEQTGAGVRKTKVE